MSTKVTQVVRHNVTTVVHVEGTNDDTVYVRRDNVQPFTNRESGKDKKRD